MKNFSVLKFTKHYYATLLCIILLIIGVLTPFYFSIMGLSTPKTVSTIFTEIDYKEVFEKSPTITEILTDYGIKSGEAEKAMASRQTAKLIESYADKVTEILLDIPPEHRIDIPLIKETVDENIDEILSITEEKIGVKLKEKKIKKDVNSFISKNEKKIKKSIPVIEKTRTTVRTICSSKVLWKPITPLTAVFLAVILLAIFIGLYLLEKTNSFLWIGIDFAVISIILGILTLYNKSHFIKNLALELSFFETEIINSAISVCVDKVLIAICGTVGLSILFFALFATVLFIKRKSKYIMLPTIAQTDNSQDI